MDTPSNDGPFSELNVMRTTNLTQLGDVRTSGKNIGFGTGVLVGIDSSTTTNVIAIGENVAADADTGAKSISMGSAFGSGFDNSTSEDGIGSASIAIGSSANGNAGTDLGTFSIMLGGATCYNGCGADVVAIGKAAGASNPPGANSIQIGTDAGQGTSSAVGASSICIGNQAGASGAGTDSILIGQAATGTSNNSIVINATGASLSSVASGLVIKPIVEGSVSGGTSQIKTPDNSGFTHLLGYNPSTGQIQSFAFT